MKKTNRISINPRKQYTSQKSGYTLNISEANLNYEMRIFSRIIKKIKKIPINSKIVFLKTKINFLKLKTY